MGVRVSAAFVDRLLAGAFAVLVAHAVVALVIGLGAYADGAWFEFALLAGKPFALVWRNYPVRLTHYLAIYAPAALLLKAHAPPAAALLLARASWFMAPVASLAGCCALIPASDRRLALAPAAWFVLVGLLSWGFPTEVLLLAAFAWPAFFALFCGRGALAGLIGAALLVAVALSYEAGAAFLPLMLWAALDRPPPDRRAAVAGAIGGSLLAGAALFLAVSLLPPSPEIRGVLRVNMAVALNIQSVMADAGVRKDLLILAAVAAAGVAGLIGPRMRAAPLALALAAGAAIAFVEVGGDPQARYTVRSFGLASLWMAMFLLLWIRRRPLTQPLPTAIPALAVLAVGLMTLSTVAENLRFALAWRAYDRAIGEAVNCAPAKGACRPGAVVDLPARTGLTLAAWRWGLPFRSILRADDLAHAQIVRDRAPDGLRPPTPLSCAAARGLDGVAGSDGPAVRSLVAISCEG